jgi:predicted Zn-dependent protease
MKYSNPKIPEGINTSHESPLKEFILLASGAFVLIIFLVTLISYLLDWGSQFIPFSYEQKIAQPFVSEFISEYSEGPNEVDTYLQGLADQIAPLMSLENNEVIKLHYVNQDTVNGMATLGGHIFIYRGLLEKLPSENALVMLLAHEIAHVKLRHPIKSLSKGVTISILLAMITGQNSADMTVFFAGSSQMAFLNYSRTQEQDADNEAVLLSEKMYQHTQGVQQLFDVLLEQSNESNFQPVALLSSHPEIEQRIQKATLLAQSNQWHQSGELDVIPNVIIASMEEDKLSLQNKEATEP